MRRIVLFLSFFAVFSGYLYASEYLEVTPYTVIKIPEVFYYQDNYRVQWWYFTGQLYDLKGREFGYQLTFFAVDVQKRKYKSRFGVNKLYISHFAITDVVNKRYYYFEKIDSGIYGFSGAMNNKLLVWVGEDRLEGDYKGFRIKARGKDVEIDLNLKPKKQLVLNGLGGYSRKSEDSPLYASIYFSYTNLETEGFLKLYNSAVNVRGKSWFDRELSTRSLSPSQKGWDWFSIRLNNGCEIMIYLLRKQDGTLDRYSSGTIVYKDGKYKHLTLNDFRVRTLSFYKSKKTNAIYPAEWIVEIPFEKLYLRIKPLVKEQEFIAYASTNNYYWEGLCEVKGGVDGRAYVELTGY